jgi:tetratricopeptide (TPR) repeat protein
VLEQQFGRQLLEHGAGLIEARFADQPKLQAELYGVVAGIFADMGANDLAVDYETRHLRALDAIGATPVDKVRAHVVRAYAYRGEGRTADAVMDAREAVRLAQGNDGMLPEAQILLAELLVYTGEREEVALLDAIDAETRGHSGPSTIRARVERVRAWLLERDNRFDEALARYRAALDQAIAAEGPQSRTVIDMQFTLASSLQAHYRPEEARPYREAALASLRASGPAGEVRAALAESALNSVLFTRGQTTFEEARAAIERDRQTLATHKGRIPDRFMASVTFDLAQLYIVWGDHATAGKLLAASAPILDGGGNQTDDAFRLAVVRAGYLSATGRHREAASLYRAENERRHALGLDRYPNTGYYYAREALNLHMDGRTQEALALLDRAPRLASMAGTGIASPFFRDVVQNVRALILIEAGHPDEAVKALLPADESDLAHLPTDNWFIHGEVLCGAGRPSEGMASYETSLQKNKGPDVIYPYNPDLARERALVGICAMTLHQRARAVEMAALAHEAFRVQPDVSPYYKKPLEQLDRLLASGN